MSALSSGLVLAVVAAGLSWALVGLYARGMRDAGRLEPLNERSMHKAPLPVGAGVGLIGAALLLWPYWRPGVATGFDHALLAGVGGLCALSWIDDRHGLSPALRLGAQALAVLTCLALLPADARVLPGLPMPLERAMLLLAWLWFINLFNFMDGIDGLAGSETMAVALGYLALLGYAGLDRPYAPLALVVAAAAAGYLVWNWHPAKVLMGDAGSIPLGFLLAWLMLDLALRGYWAAGLILPLYFLADATVTLLARAWRGEAPWQAHREHFYQRAVLGGGTPSGVVLRIVAVNVALVALAFVSLSRPAAALVVAGALVAGLLVHLSRVGGR